MSKEEQIRKGFREMIPIPTQLFIAEVTAVDEANMTVEVEPIEVAELEDVRLKAGIDGVKDGIVEFPKVGSSVLVGIIGNDEDTCVVLKCSKVEKVVINGGDNGGLVLSPVLVSELGKMSARVDALYDAINNAVPIPQDGGVGLQNTMKSTLASVTETEDFSQIENDKVTH